VFTKKLNNFQTLLTQAGEAILFCLFLILLLAQFNFVSIYAQEEKERGLIITPIIIEQKVKRGENYQIEIEAINNTRERDYNIEMITQKFTTAEEEGIPVILPLEAEDSYADWLSYQDPEFSLEPGESKKQIVNLSIPQDANPGGYYYAVTFSSANENNQQAEGNQLLINERIASLLFIEVEGQIQREVTVKNFQTDRAFYDPWFDSIFMQYQVELTGNSHLKPSGNVIFGEQTDNGFAINPEQKIIFPNTARSFSSQTKPDFKIPFLSYNPFLEEVSNTDSENFEQVSKKIIGSQKVNIRVLYVNSNQELTFATSTQEIFFFPWKVLTIFLLLIIIATTGFFYYRRTKIKSKKPKSG